jgi:hypothetical protein
MENCSKDFEMAILMEVEIDRLSCGGCERSVAKTLFALPEVSDFGANCEHHMCA